LTESKALPPRPNISLGFSRLFKGFFPDWWGASSESLYLLPNMVRCAKLQTLIRYGG
jgi:hypothetical protein